MANTQDSEVDFRYQPDELKSLLAVARLEDQDACGRYHVLSSSVQVYDGPQPQTGWDRGNKLMGSLRYSEGTGIVGIEVQPPFTTHDMLLELAILELRAFRCIKNGAVPSQRR